MDLPYGLQAIFSYSAVLDIDSKGGGQKTSEKVWLCKKTNILKQNEQKWRTIYRKPYLVAVAYCRRGFHRYGIANFCAATLIGTFKKIYYYQKGGISLWRVAIYKNDGLLCDTDLFTSRQAAKNDGSSWDTQTLSRAETTQNGLPSVTPPLRPILPTAAGLGIGVTTNDRSNFNELSSKFSLLLLFKATISFLLPPSKSNSSCANRLISNSDLDCDILQKNFLATTFKEGENGGMKQHRVKSSRMRNEFHGSKMQASSFLSAEESGPLTLLLLLLLWHH